jgi:transcription initiation factor TFIID subunit 2
MKAVTTALIPSGDVFHFGFGTEDEDIKNAAFAEIERLLRMDRWIPSFQHTVSQSALLSKEQLSTKGIGSLPLSELMLYCREGIFDILRAQAFDILLNLGGLRHAALIKFVFFTLRMDPSPYIRRRLANAIARGLGGMALTGNVTTSAGGDEMVVEEDAAQSISVRKDILDRASISGAINAIRKELASNETLKSEIWNTAKYLPKPPSLNLIYVLTKVPGVNW